MTYKVKLANGKHLTLRGDEPPTDQDIEQAADQAGVRSLLMREPDNGRASKEPSHSNAASIVSALSVLTGAGMAAAPAVVTGARAVAPKLIPGATALTVANDLRKGDVMKAAEHGVLGTAAASTLGKVIEKVAPHLTPADAHRLFPTPGGAATRVAAGMRAASPAAAMGSVIAAGHAAKMDPKNQPKIKTLTAREIAEEEMRRLVGGGM